MEWVVEERGGSAEGARRERGGSAEGARRREVEWVVEGAWSGVEWGGSAGTEGLCRENPAGLSVIGNDGIHERTHTLLTYAQDAEDAQAHGDGGEHGS